MLDDETPKAQIPENRRAQDAPMSFADMLAPMMAAAQARQDERAAHRADCTETPCRLCDRNLCRHCKAPSGDRSICASCDIKDRVAAARESIPKRFRWAIGADRATILSTAAKLIPGVVDGGLAWARLGATRGLALLGAPGMGKTSLAVAMFDAWLASHGDASARFIESFQLAQARARHPLGQGEAPPVTAAMKCGLLVLDDVGCEPLQRSEVIADVLMARHNDELPTWITTWLTVEEMTARYGGGGFRRIYEGSKVVSLG